MTVNKRKPIWELKLHITHKKQAWGSREKQSTVLGYEYGANKKRIACNVKAPPLFEPKNPQNFLSWLFPMRRKHPPSHFSSICMVELLGLQVTRWVFEAAVRQMPQQEGRPGLPGMGLCTAWTRPAQEDSCSLVGMWGKVWELGGIDWSFCQNSDLEHWMWITKVHTIRQGWGGWGGGVVLSEPQDVIFFF